MRHAHFKRTAPTPDLYPGPRRYAIGLTQPNGQIDLLLRRRGLAPPRIWCCISILGGDTPVYSMSDTCMYSMLQLHAAFAHSPNVPIGSHIRIKSHPIPSPVAFTSTHSLRNSPGIWGRSSVPVSAMHLMNGSRPPRAADGQLHGGEAARPVCKPCFISPLAGGGSTIMLWRRNRRKIAGLRHDYCSTTYVHTKRPSPRAAQLLELVLTVRDEPTSSPPQRPTGE